MVPGQAGRRRSSVSLFLTSMVETALRLPDTIERKLSPGGREGEEGGEGQGSVGQFLRGDMALMRAISPRRREEEEEWETGFHGVVRPLGEVVQQEELLSLLTCSCGKLCLPPLQQCRRGHLACRYSRSSSRRWNL